LWTLTGYQVFLQWYTRRPIAPQKKWNFPPPLFFSRQFAEAVPEGQGFVIVVTGKGVGWLHWVDKAKNKNKKKKEKFLLTPHPFFFCLIRLPSLMPRDSVHSSGCMHIVCQAGGGNSVHGGVGSPGAYLRASGVVPAWRKRLVHCTCRLVMKDDGCRTDLWAAPC
jgi:hypothetical protein